MVDAEYEVHDAMLKRSWKTFYTGQVLNAVTKSSTKGSIATIINTLTTAMQTHGCNFEELDEELKTKANSFTKFGSASQKPSAKGGATSSTV